MLGLGGLFNVVKQFHNCHTPASTTTKSATARSAPSATSEPPNRDRSLDGRRKARGSSRDEFRTLATKRAMRIACAGRSRLGWRFDTYLFHRSPSPRSMTPPTAHNRPDRRLPSDRPCAELRTSPAVGDGIKGGGLCSTRHRGYRNPLGGTEGASREQQPVKNP